jgi:hypothetical protein
MFQREAVRQALEQRRATFGNSPRFQKAAEFLTDALSRPDDCWEALAEEYRRSYTDVTDEIVAVLTATDDPLIIYNMLKMADTSDPKQAEAVRQVVRNIDPEKHRVSLLALTGDTNVRAAVRRKEGLPASVRAALDPQPEHGAAAEAEDESQPSSKPAPKRTRTRRTTKKRARAER